jgi:hypothetical protein
MDLYMESVVVVLAALQGKKATAVCKNSFKGY